MRLHKTLRMATPQKHRNGKFYLRLWVPEDLRPIVGKREVTRSLGTRDASEAKGKFKLLQAQIEAEWGLLRAVLRVKQGETQRQSG